MFKRFICVTIILTIIFLLFGYSKSPSKQLEESTSLPSDENQSFEDVAEKQAPQGEEADAGITVVNKPSETIHIKETLSSGGVTLNIDLDVVDYPNAEFGLYDTDEADFDFEAWYGYFFPGQDREDLYHFYQDPKIREKRGVGDDYLYTKFTYLQMAETDIDTTKESNDKNKMAYYDRGRFNYRDILTTSATIEDFYTSLDKVGIRYSEEEYAIPDMEKLQKAEELSDDFFSFLFQDEFKDNFALGYSGLRMTHPGSWEAGDYSDERLFDVYLVSFDRYIEGLPIMFDYEGEENGHYIFQFPDTLNAFVYEGELFMANGYIRQLKFVDTTKIISAEEALDILKIYFSTARASGTFDINRFQLMYFPDYPVNEEELVPISSFDLNSTYVRYKPVWVVSSGVRISPNGAESSGEYALIIDAGTGEIITPLEK